MGENIVLWSGLSREAFDALIVIRAENEYELQPSSMLTCLLDGGYPIAKQAWNYAKPHWCPVVFKRREPAARCRL